MTTFDHQSGAHLSIHGADIYYEQTGNPNGPPLLLLHGGLGTIEDFNDILPSLSEFRIIGIDSRGHGKSTLGEAPLSYKQSQHDVQSVIKHLKLDAVSVVGFSDGGIIGYRLAAARVANVNKLVTIGAQWQLRPDDPTLPIFRKVTAESWRAKFPETYEIYQRLNPASDFDRLVKAVIPMWVDFSPTGYPGESVDRIECPVLLVRGDDDHLVALDSLVELRGRIADAELSNIAFAGHVAFDDQKDVFLTALHQFLQ